MFLQPSLSSRKVSSAGLLSPGKTQASTLFSFPTQSRK
jgi:hypothetical protein